MSIWGRDPAFTFAGTPSPYNQFSQKPHHLAPEMGKHHCHEHLLPQADTHTSYEPPTSLSAWLVGWEGALSWIVGMMCLPPRGKPGGGPGPAVFM